MKPSYSCQQNFSRRTQKIQDRCLIKNKCGAENHFMYVIYSKNMATKMDFAKKERFNLI